MKSIRKTGVTKRILSSALAACMLFTMSPPITAAEAQVKDRGEILLSGFAELPVSVREQRVPLGTPLAELKLPDKLEATVYNASHSNAIVLKDADAVPPTEVLPPQEPTALPSDDLDSGTGETEIPPDNELADEESGEESTPLQEDAPQDSEETKEMQEVPASAAEVTAFSTGVSAVQYLAAPAGNTRQLIALSENKTPLAASPSDADGEETEQTVTVRGVTWDSDPLYDENTAGTYSFTAVLPEGYIVEDGVSNANEVGMPQITVIVEEAPMPMLLMKGAADHDHSGWTAWTATDALPTTAGDYYLDADVTLTNRGWGVPKGATRLCLNGHIVELVEDVGIALWDASESEEITLCIYDETGNGVIKNANDSPTISVDFYARLELYGGTLRNEGGDARDPWGTLIPDGGISGTALGLYGGTARISGGALEGATYGITLESLNMIFPKLYLSGTPSIVGGTAALFIPIISIGAESVVVANDGAATPSYYSDDPLSVKLELPPAIDGSLFADGLSDADQAALFQFEQPYYTDYVAAENGALYVKPYRFTQQPTTQAPTVTVEKPDGETPAYQWYTSTLTRQMLDADDEVVVDEDMGPTCVYDAAIDGWKEPMSFVFEGMGQSMFMGFQGQAGKVFSAKIGTSGVEGMNVMSAVLVNKTGDMFYLSESAPGVWSQTLPADELYMLITIVTVPEGTNGVDVKAAMTATEVSLHSVALGDPITGQTTPTLTQFTEPSVLCQVTFENGFQLLSDVVEVEIRVAEVTINGITTGYPTFAEAWAAVNVDGQTSTIKLLDDITPENYFTAANAPIKLNTTANITLDLNGKTIDRGLTVATQNGNVIQIDNSGASLTIKDSGTTGKITGGFANESGGGGGINLDSGSFEMQGGTISGNKASNGGGIYASTSFKMTGGSISGNTASEVGGGVFVETDFVMQGGTISGNSASHGGGIAAASGDITLTGGTVTGNTVTALPQGTDPTMNYGGGIYVSAASALADLMGGGLPPLKLKISGSVQIYDNYRETGTGTVADNVTVEQMYIPAGAMGPDSPDVALECLPIISGALTGTKPIGISKAKLDTNDMNTFIISFITGVVAEADAGYTITAADIAKLKSDDPSHSVFKNADGKVEIGTPDSTAPTISATAPTPPQSGWFTADTAISVTFADNVAVTKLYAKVDSGSYTEISGFGTSPYSYAVSTEGEHTYTFKAEDGAGNSAESTPVTVKLDKTAPTFTSVPAASEVNDTTAKITFTPSEGGTVYWVVNPASTPSTAQDVKTHADKQSQAVTGSTESTLSLSNLPVGSTQTVYMVVEDAAGNLTELKEVTFYTLQVAPVVDFSKLTVDYAGEKVTVPSGTEIYTNPANPGGSVLVPDANDKVSVTPGDTIYVRYPAKDGGNIPPSAGTAIVMPARPTAPNVKTVEQKDKQLTISPVVTGEEYVIVPKGDSPDWSKAQSGGVFTGLDPNKEYDIYARVKAVTGSSFASNPTKTETKTLVEVTAPTTSGAGAGQDGNTAATPSTDVDQDNITYKGGYSKEYTPSIVIGGTAYTPNMTWNEATGKGEWSYTYDIQPGDGKVTAEVIFTARQLTGITAANVTLFADHAANGNATDLKAWLDGDSNKVQAAYDNKTTANITAVHSTSDSFDSKGGTYTYTATVSGKTASRTVTVKAVTATITAPADITLVKKPTDGYTFAELSLVGTVTVTYTGDGYTQKTASVAASWTNNMPADFGKTEGEHTFNGTAALPAWASGANNISTKVSIINKTPLTADQMTLTMPGFTYGGTENTPQGSVTVSDTNGSYTYSYSTDGGSNWVNSLPKSTAGKVKAGTYSVKMEYSGDNYAGSKTITITVAKKNTAVTISCTGKAFDDNDTANADYTVSGKVGNDDVTANGTAVYSDKNAGSRKTVTATGITLTGSDADNYNLTAATATTTANITAKAITPTIEAIPAQTFTGSQLTPVVTVKDSNTVLTLNTDYTVAYGTNTNASAGAGRVTVTLKGNYSGTATANFDISKAAASTVANNNVSTAYADTANKTYPLTGLPVNLGTVTFTKGTVTDTNSILNGTPTVDSSTGALSYQLASGLTESDNNKTATIAITVNSTNYESFTVNVVIMVTNRTDVSGSITFADGSTTYNGAVQTHETAAISGQTGGNMSYTYTTTDGVLEDGKPKGAGTYIVTATYENAIALGSKTATFVISKKEVIVKADDKSITKGQSIPTFTVSYGEFAGTDSKANTLTTEAVASCTADGKTVGSFPITFSTNAVLNDGVGKNYTLVHKNGVLEVKNISDGGNTGGGGSSGGGSSGGSGGGTTDPTPPEKPTDPVIPENPTPTPTPPTDPTLPAQPKPAPTPTPTPKPTEPKAPDQTPEPLAKPPAKPSKELPTGDTVKTVPAELTDGKIQPQTNEPKIETGKSEASKNDTELTVLTVGNGAVIVTVSEQDGKRMAQVKDTVAVANAVLSDHEKQLVNAGEVIEIRIDVKDMADTTEQADKELVKEGIEAYQTEIPDLELGMYVDISMFIRVGNSDWNPITSTDEPIEVTIEIPKELRQLDADFYMIRAHEGEFVLLKDMDDNPETITIKTQLFSTYAITYQTKAAQETAQNTKSDDSDADEPKKAFCLIDRMTAGRTSLGCWWCWIVLAAILAATIGGIVWKCKKK